MLDLIMVATLAVCCGLVYLWSTGVTNRWTATNDPGQCMKGGSIVIILGVIVLLLGAYLVYALVHPEKF